jgi:DNA-binding Xre family transcriptional regulator
MKKKEKKLMRRTVVSRENLNVAMNEKRLRFSVLGSTEFKN